MVGTSWSGFNGLQLAARTPPALGAVISIYASDDRYADDVHYRGGLVIPMDMAQWANCMLSWNALPPDPGDRRRRLARRSGASGSSARRTSSSAGSSHQLRDDYWRHGSACEHYAGHPLPGDGDRRLDRRLHRRRAAPARAPRRAAPRPDRALGAQRSGARRPGARRRLAGRVRALLRPLAQGRAATASTTSRC